MTTLLQTLIDACQQRDIAETAFGRRYFNDPRFIWGLRQGRTLRPVSLERVNSILADLGREIDTDPAAHRKDQRSLRKVRISDARLAALIDRIDASYATMMRENSQRFLAAILREAGRA